MNWNKKSRDTKILLRGKRYFCLPMTPKTTFHPYKQHLHLSKKSCIPRIVLYLLEY